MKKIKYIFNSFILTFVLLGVSLCGITFFNHKEKILPQSSAAEIHDQITNNLNGKEYFIAKGENVNPENAINQTLYLMKDNGQITFSMTNGYIKEEGGILTEEEKGTDTIKRNPAYIPDESNPNRYYYFDFTNTIALLYNVTNEEIEVDAIQEEKNLLSSILPTNFIKTPENGFEIDKYAYLPEEFNLILKLNADKLSSTKAQATNVGETVTVNKEGCYTLVIPYTYYLTNDSGNTWIEDSTDYILYSFMIFESNTYLNNTTNLPNTKVDPFVHTSLLNSEINSTYSVYYYYNYSAQKTSENLSPLPQIEYDPKLYDITINYRDIDDNQIQTSLRLEYLDDESYDIAAFDENDNRLSTSPIIYKYDKESNRAYITFDNLGTYDLSFSFIYTEQNKTFTLPMTTRKQRFYMYGLQSYYTTSERDEVTQETISKELKDVIPEKSAFKDSADVTSLVATKNQEASSESLTASTIATAAIEKLNKSLETEHKIEPVSTNQPPIKFRRNKNIKNLSESSKYYMVEKNDDGNYELVKKDKSDALDEKDYSGENLRESGTYLLIAIYNFDDYTSSTGTPQTNYYHYQVFFFTITNTSPYASVYAVKKTGTREEDIEYPKLYSGDYTNQDVIVVNESGSSKYDADLTITLRAQNYANNYSDFFIPSEVNILQYASGRDGIKYWDNLGEIADDSTEGKSNSFEGKKGLYITATGDYPSPYRNALFTVSVKSQGSLQPTKTSFIIDTNPISQIQASAVTSVGNSFIKEQNTFIPNNKSNDSLIFSWEEKASKASTHGYFKYYPLKEAQYYYTGNSAEGYNTQILDVILKEHGIVPINYQLDLTSDNIGWNSYTNTYDFRNSTTIADDYVRSAPGLYVFEVFDDAGNVGFNAFLIDNTAPIFLKKIEIKGVNYTYSIMSTTEPITIPNEINNRLTIEWGNKKGIYINNFSNNESDSLYKNNSKIDGQDLTTLGNQNPLYEKLQEFFSQNTEQISDITVQRKSGDSYNGQYLTIDIVKNAMVAEKVDTATNKEYQSYTGNSYRIYYFKGENAQNTETGKFTEINEGTYKFLIRDYSNTKGSIEHTKTSFLEYPSSFTTVVISSDSSQLRFLINGDIDKGFVTPDGYSVSGSFYKDRDDQGEILVKNAKDEAQETSDKKYKYQYYSPIKTEEPIILSYIPLAVDDSKIASLKVRYYPFVRADEKFDMVNNVQQENVDKDKYDTYEAKAYYYTLSDEYSEYELNLDTKEKGQALTYTFSFSDDNKAEPGKYVVTRTYEDDKTGNQYDFHERTFTLIIDRYNVISAEEKVSTEKDGQTYNSLESVVGGDILVSMYSNNGQQQFTLSFPNYNKETSLNQGSLYTEPEYSNENAQAVPIFETNKAPVAVNVPVYKYTTHNQYEYGTNSYSVDYNNDLSYYGGHVEKVKDEKTNRWCVYTEIVYDENGHVDTTRSLQVKNADGRIFLNEREADELIVSLKNRASMNAYKLYATISYTANGQTNPTLYYKTATDLAENSDDGYLRFYSVNSFSDDVTTNSRTIQNFTNPGTYQVTVYQAANEESSDNKTSFKSLYKFAFEILENRPTFEIVSTDWNQLSEMVNNTYYTNKKTVRVRWEDPTSEFMAKVNKDRIEYYYTNPLSPATWPKEDIKTDHQISYFDFDLSPIWAKDATVTFRLYFEGLNVYTERTVHIDYSAPLVTLSGLMDKVESSTNLFSRLYQEKNMRSHYKADATEPEDTSAWNFNNLESKLQDISYSYLNEAGRFKFYSYTVDDTFFNNAITQLNNNKSDRTKAQHLYIRSLSENVNEEDYDPLENYIPARDNFDEILYTDLLQYDSFDISAIERDRNNSQILSLIDIGTYFEVIETDLAGNMSVYLVYYVHGLQDEDTLDYLGIDNLAAITYTDKTSETNEPVTNAQIKNDNFNLFSNSDFQIKDLNYNGDQWAIYRITFRLSRTESVERIYMCSPHALNSQDEQGKTKYIYQVEYDGTDYNFTLVTTENIFATISSSNFKHAMQVSDRITGQQKTVYISVMDGSLRTYKDSQNSILRIDVPANYDSLEIAYVYPVKITIDQFENGGWDKNLYSETSTNPTSWQDNDNITFTYVAGQLQIKINVFEDAVKFKYMITDNFGNVTTVIQLVNEEIIENEVAVLNGGRYWQIDEPSEIQNTTYIAASAMSFYYNSLIYNAQVVEWYENGLFDENKVIPGQPITSTTYSGNIQAFTLNPTPVNGNYNSVYVIRLSDADDIDTPIRYVNLHVYNALPEINGEEGETPQTNYIRFLNSNFNVISGPYEKPTISVNFNGKEITTQSTAITTFSSSITLEFSDGQRKVDGNEYSYKNNYTYSTYLSNDGITWQNISLENDRDYRIDEAGTYYILFKYDSEVQLTDQYKIFTLYILNSSSVSFYFHLDGKPVEVSSGFSIVDNFDVRQETVYFLNINYEEKQKTAEGKYFTSFEDSRIKIEANDQLNTKFDDITHYVENGNGMVVDIEIYNYSSDITSKSSFAVVYIGESTNILTDLHYEDAPGAEYDLLISDDLANPDDIVLPDLSRLKLTWNNYYAIPENKVNISAFKKYNNRYVEIYPTVYTEGTVNYIYLSRAGSYRLYFEDSCQTPNTQMFDGVNYININFLSSVPFTITYTDPISQEEITSEPINRAVFNGQVTLTMTDVSLFHETPQIEVEKDGVTYNGYTRPTMTSFLFSETGYYEVKFIAKGRNLEDVRQETYIFSIINPNESRFAFEYSEYANYYVKQIIRNGVDETDKFVQTIDGKKMFIEEEGKYYLTSLQVSYFDEKTGNGQNNNYIITIATNDNEFKNTTSSTFSFAFRINLAYPPITVSIAQGGSTTKTIKVSYNPKMIYDMIGDCIIKLPGYQDIRIEAENSSDTTVTQEISVIGTNYIQVYTMSGSLLYSYRITRNEPLRPWTIIVIVVAVIAVAIIVFITVKLRKRLKVK